MLRDYDTGKLMGLRRVTDEELSRGVNTGLIITEPDVKDYVVGSYRDIAGAKVLLQSGDWRPYAEKIDPEAQLNNGLEVFSCVTFSALNNLEVLSIFHGVPTNLSDRFIAAMSGTTQHGNSLNRVAETIRVAGCVTEAVYPWGGKTFSEYMQPVPQEIRDQAQPVPEYGYAWFGGFQDDQLREQLKYGPLQITVSTLTDWSNPDEVPLSPASAEQNHAILLLYVAPDGARYVLDHYKDRKGSFIKRLAPGYKLYAKMTHSINPETMTNAFFYKTERGEYGVGNPATTPDAVISGAMNHGLTVPMKPGVPENAPAGERIDWVALDKQCKKMSNA